MPAIRDVAWTFESVTTDGGVTVPMPAYAENDLLLAFIQSDTGTPALTSSGWTQVFTRTNTTSLTVLRKIATASEPATVAFASAVAETYNGAIVSIRDVDTTTPVNISNDTTQAAAAKYTFQSVTTTRDNCLLLYAAANSGVGVPSIIEGPVSGLLGADGAAESQGIGWSVKTTAGATPANVTCSNIATGAGVKAVIAINPPSGGAAVVPAFCAADASVYVDPLNGTTAYNGNAAPAATADTLFGATLNGVTAGDATVAAAADAGLNSFHSVAQLTSISASANWSGAALDLAAGNVLSLAGKNVLVHTSPSTAGQIQRFPSASAAKKGIALGMLSTAGNWKAWYVHAAGTGWGQSRDVPLVINSDNSGGVIHTAGTLNAGAVDALGIWVSSIGVTTTIWQFYSAWVLDTVTVAGGNAAEPVGIGGLVQAASGGHERRSLIQQGANQALILQPVKLGDGGTNKLYLDLDATAIEFPRIHELARKEINYCSSPNVAGLTYHGGSADTIKHRNSVISSPSAYHWRIQSGAAGTYDFSGLQVIGAGDVQLRDITAPAQYTFTGVTWSACGQIVQNSAWIAACAVKGSVAASALLAGNPGRISGCTFTSGGTGHALEITTPGTYTFSANQFSGYGAGGTTNAAIYNNSGGAVTLNISGGGATPTVRNGAGASTTVNNTVNLTLSGLQTGSDIVILDAGTETERANVNANAGASYVYGFQTGGDVDICVYKQGYVPWTIRAYTLPASDGSLPVSQTIDRNFAA